ncbi:MAG: lipocalin family protein [Pseudoxanthomonas suwonensis]|nr:lipocalin family protein [Pseudoxanthomonas suwonensis]
MSRPPPPTVPFVDLQRYLGTWYEIVRKPIRHEDTAARDVTATYTLQDDGSIEVLNRSLDENGEYEDATGRATVVDTATNAKLEVSFLPAGLRWIPFTKGDYWVLRVDDGYNMALVGTPDYKYLWLLARDADPGHDTIVQWLDHASALGYETGDVIRPVQSGAVPTPD